jgi:hypothetical protein
MTGKEQLQPNQPFEFSEHERLYDRLSHARFEQLLRDQQTTIHAAELSSNSFGEFLFVTISRRAVEKQTYLTFYGLGYHDYRERWLTETWRWYEAMETPGLEQRRLSRAEIQQLLTQRQAEIRPYLNQDTQTKRGKLFDWLADLTDEDGALSELEDLGGAVDWLLNDEDDSE